MADLKQYIAEIPNFPSPGILFRDISPLLRDHFDLTLQALEDLLTPADWRGIDALAGIESAASSSARRSRLVWARASC